MKEKELESLRSQLEITESNLHKEILEQATLYLRWAIRAARSGRRLKEIQMQTKVVAATEMKRIRQEHFEKTKKELAATISLDKTELPLSKEYSVQMQKQIEAEEDYDILVAARESAKQRKDMLVQAALTLRDETKSNIIIKNRQQED